VEEYLAAAERHGARIVAILETHPHADFVSGHVELAQRTGATIFVSNAVRAKYPHRGLRHGEPVPVGSLRVTALETPGHSPDSMSYYVEAEGGRTVAGPLPGAGQRVVFTGDTLFVGDVGRPDLRDADADPRAMASALHDTLHQVLYQLPEDTVVYPAHGAGSLCGRKIGTAPTTTIGAEKRVNWANQFRDREAFVEAMVSNLPDRPAYFSYDVGMNLAGARPLGEVPRPRPLDPASLRATDALILDTRAPEEYGAAHLAGSLNIGIALPVFSTWVGFFVDPCQPVVLVVEDAEDAERAWLELARIGYENVRGYVLADREAWQRAGLEVRQTKQMDVCCLEPWLREGGRLLDVRTPGEFKEGHIDAATWIPLSSLPERLRDVPSGPVPVMCGSGYRSSLATSLLERAGWKDVANVRGGWSAWTRRQCVEPDARDLAGNREPSAAGMGRYRGVPRPLTEPRP
jgi:glyoxylase-like metal-dependent hydrolase (beta-lactamase superfamily II)/rhodanese-related sulfurtransferase